MYRESIDVNVADLNKFFDEGNLETYRVRIHSVKSTSYTIGATVLGDAAQKLEEAAHSGDDEYIAENHKIFVEEYLKLKRLISDVVSAK